MRSRDYFRRLPVREKKGKINNLTKTLPTYPVALSLSFPKLKRAKNRDAKDSLLSIVQCR